MTEAKNGATWVRWAAGIVITILLLLLTAIQGWVVNQITEMQRTMADRTALLTSTHQMAEESKEKVDSVIEAINSLRMELALVGQEMRFERLRKEEDRKP